jgi:DNA-binding NtrC family response regulator
MKEAVMQCILIIEDDTTFSLILSTWLKKKNFTVKAVTSVSDAKQEIEAGNYNLLLSDFRLPDGDGINILRNCFEFIHFTLLSIICIIVRYIIVFEVSVSTS